MRIALMLPVATAIVAAAIGPASAYNMSGGNQSIISCSDLCVAKAAAPKPGQPHTGHLVRQCVNTLTGQFVGERAIPFTPCNK